MSLGKFLKNVAIQGQKPKLEEVEHVHYFHTVLSNGKKQDRTTSVGGHFHMIELINNPDPSGPPKITKVGPAMTSVRRKDQYGQYKIQTVPAPFQDTHTHDAVYLGSDRIVPKTTNEEAAKVIGAEAMKSSVPDGVSVR